jgi:putative membrane protein
MTPQLSDFRNPRARQRAAANANWLSMSAPDQSESNSREKKGQLDPDKIESEILANERTFLAWVRTSIAVMSLGFVIARFSIWFREVATRVNPQTPVHGSGLSAPLGECMIGAGAMITVFAAWRYHVINRSIRRGQIQADPLMVAVITAIVVLAAMAVIAYMLVSTGSG